MKPLLPLLFSLLLVLGCDDNNNTPHTNNHNNTNNTNNTNTTGHNNGTCGDGVVDVGEQCDTANLGGQTCEGLGFASGVLQCNAGCTYDTSGCEGMGGPYGFRYRSLGSSTLECEDWDGQMTSEEYPYVDQICTIEYGAISGYVYFQATAASCELIMFPIPVYQTEAWISIDGVVTPLEASDYDYGGNHNNDFFSFTHEGTNYMFYHSSFGYGWRRCQPMDCIQILDSEGTVIEDGCTTERTLPIVCTPITGDATFAPLVDNFEYCEGDPNVTDEH